MSTPSSEQDRILHEIEALSEEAQLALARMILQRVNRSRSQQKISQPSRLPSAALRGLLANGEAAPSDAEVERWREEARWEKYGG
ncbi:MAG TPA: hypothetical protein VF808_13860 [Ktedonobacterales bacterium]